MGSYPIAVVQLLKLVAAVAVVVPDSGQVAAAGFECSVPWPTAKMPAVLMPDMLLHFALQFLHRSDLVMTYLDQNSDK